MSAKIEATAIYFCDNGAAYCGDHLGMTARASGRDISGQPISRVTPDDVREASKMGVKFKCEIPSCGREASSLWSGS